MRSNDGEVVPIKCITLLPVGHTAQRKEGLFVQTFYKICLILMIVGGINWGLVGLFQFDLSAGCWAAARPSGHASYSRWWAWPLSAVSRAFLQTRPGSRDKRKRLSCRQEIRHESLFDTYKESRPDVCGNQTYPCGQVGALSPVSRFLIEPSWSTHDGEVCNPPTNSKLPLND